jgi:hypothetical protein
MLQRIGDPVTPPPTPVAEPAVDDKDRDDVDPWQ